MSNIRIDLDTTIYDGQTITFKSPCDCSAVTGLKVYYPNAEGVQSSQIFTFADAHGNDVGTIDELFAENVLVKVILDTTTNKAFVQNADTNAYLENKFEKLNKPIGTYIGNGSDSPRTIETGGIGTCVYIHSSYGGLLLTSRGGIVMKGSTGDSLKIIDATECYFNYSNGNILMDTTNEIINGSGRTYTYHVI